MRLHHLASVSLGALLTLIGSGNARAATLLTDANSQVTVDNRNGMTVWKVNNTADNVFLSNYYIRLGATGNEFALSQALGAPVVQLIGSNRVTLTYQKDSLLAVVEYRLTGGMPGAFDSRVDTSIALSNLGSSPLDLHLFQYSDFDLKFDQSAQLDQIRYRSRSSLIQYRSGTYLGLLADVDTEPTHYQATSDFLDFYFKFFLDQDGPTTLNDTPGIGLLFPDPAKDSAFAFQWDRELAAGETFRVASSFRLTAVPEPSSLALAGFGVAGLALASSRFRRVAASDGTTA